MPWLSKYYSSTKIRPVESEATRWTAPAPTGWAASAPPPGRPWPGSTIPSTAIAADWLFNSSGGVVSTPDLVSFLLDHTLRYPRFRVLSAHLHTGMINSSIHNRKKKPYGWGSHLSILAWLGLKYEIHTNTTMSTYPWKQSWKMAREPTFYPRVAT